MRLIKRRKKQQDVGPPPGGEGAGIAVAGSPEEPVADDPGRHSHLPSVPGPSANPVASELGQLRFVAVEQAVEVGHLGVDPGLYPGGKLRLPSHDAIKTGHDEADARRMGRSATHLAPMRAEVHTTAQEVVKARLELDETDRAVLDALEREEEEATCEEAPDLGAAPEPLDPVVEPEATTRPVPLAVRFVLEVVARYEYPLLGALVALEAAVSGTPLEKALGLDIEYLGFVVGVALAAVMVLAAEQAGALLLVARRGPRLLGATLLALLLALSVPLGIIRAAEVVDGDPAQWILVHTGIQALAVLVGVSVVLAKRYGYTDPTQDELHTAAPPAPTLQQLVDARGELVDRVIDAVAVFHRVVEVANASSIEAEAFKREIAAAAQHTLASHDHALLVTDPTLGPFLEKIEPPTDVAVPADAKLFDADAILERALAAFSLPDVYRPPDKLASGLVPLEVPTSEPDTSETEEAPEEAPEPTEGVSVGGVDLGVPAASTNGPGEAVTS